MKQSVSLHQGTLPVQSLWQRLSDKLGHKAHDGVQEEQDWADWELLEQVQEAKAKWQGLQSVLNEVSDPRAMEQVIHQLIAAEKRYDYLLQLIKEADLRNDTIELR